MKTGGNKASGHDNGEVMSAHSPADASASGDLGVEQDLAGAALMDPGVAMTHGWRSLQEMVKRLTPALSKACRIPQACAWLAMSGDRCDTCPHAENCRDHASCLHRLISVGFAEDDATARMPLDALPETLVGTGCLRLERDPGAAVVAPLWEWFRGMEVRTADMWCFTAEGRVVAVWALGHARQAPAPAQLEPLRRQFRMHIAGAMAMEREGAQIQRLQEMGLRLAVNNERLRGALHARNLMITSLSRELRTGLNAVIGLSEVVRNGAAGDITERQSAYLSTVIAGGRRLARLMEDLLDIAAIETGDFVMRAEPCIAARMLAEAAQSVQAVARSRGVTLHLELPRDDVVVVLDPARLRQVAVNLLSAAVRLSPSGSAVNLAAEVAGGALLLRIRHPGPAAAAGAWDAVFDELRTGAPDAEADDTSSGLRLALAKRLVEAHGGAIDATDLAEGGSEFVARLPFAPAPEAQQAPTERRPCPRGAQPPAEGPVAAVIEQDVPSRIVLAQTAAAAGFAVVEFTDGDALLACVEHLRPAVVVLGQARGAAVLEPAVSALRARDDGLDIPVVFVGHSLLCEQALQVGVSATMSYPVDRTRLTTLLRHVGMPAPEGGPRLALIMDDNPTYADAMAAILEAAGMSALKARDGVEGLAMAQRLTPDAILLDLMMPRANGLEVIQRLQEHDNTRHIPVIVLTVKPLSACETRNLQALAAGVLPKAVFSPKAVYDALREAGVDLHHDAG